MDLNHRVFDVWAFRRRATGVEYLLLQASELKAERYFNGGRFWQIPSGVYGDGETVPAANREQAVVLWREGEVSLPAFEKQHATRGEYPGPPVASGPSIGDQGRG